jgi:GPH family glycoside/pentoside/hexuronide:cation symporter
MPAVVTAPLPGEIRDVKTPRTLAADRVGPRETAGLGAGKVVVEGTHLTLHVLVNPIYNVTMGVSPALISTVVFIQRLWDAMLDPFIGQLSDNFRSRWGRRLPLMAASALPLAVLFGALWWFPRQASEQMLFVYLLTVSLVFYVAHSCFAMPLAGLMIEATDDYHERTRLMGVMQACGFAFQILSQWIFKLTQWSGFPDTVTGLRWVSIGGVIIFALAGLTPVFLCRERHYARVAARQPRLPLIASLRAVRHNRPFLILLGARFAVSFTYNIVSMLVFYMNAYYVFGGDIKGSAFAFGVVGSSYHVAAIIGSLFIYPPLTRRVGKKRVFQIAAGVLMAGCFSKLFLYQAGHPWLQIIVIGANGLSSSGMGLMAGAMLGDIADDDEARTGMRREGLFASVLSWFDKAGMSFGALLGGFVLVWIGFNAKLGAQSAHTLALMKYSYFLAPFLGALLGLLLIQRYELSETQAYEIKAELARRRAL